MARRKHNMTTESISSVTVLAVDQIGDTAAKAIEAQADAHERKAKQDADRMRELAATIRHECANAHAHIELFSSRADDVMTTMADLKDRIAPQGKPMKPLNGGDGPPIPKFLEQGPIVKGVSVS
jgi:hypothetical protein